MGTSSTYVAFKQQLVTELTANLATSGLTGGQVLVSYSWLGPANQSDAVYLGRRADVSVPPSTRIESTIPTIKAGRKQRQETYTVEATIQAYRADLDVDEAATAEAWAFSILDRLDDLLADDPKIGLTSIQWARLGDVEIVGGGPIPNPSGSGWLMLLLASIEVQARLT